MFKSFADYLLERRNWIGCGSFGVELRDKIKLAVNEGYVSDNVYLEIFPSSLPTTYLSDLKNNIEEELGCPSYLDHRVPICVFTVGVISEMYKGLLAELGPVNLLKDGCLVTFRDLLKNDVFSSEESDKEKIDVGIIDPNALRTNRIEMLRKRIGSDVLAIGYGFPMCIKGKNKTLHNLNEVNQYVRKLALEKTQKFKGDNLLVDPDVHQDTPSMLKPQCNMNKLEDYDNPQNIRYIQDLPNPRVWISVDYNSTLFKHVCNVVDNPGHYTISDIDCLAKGVANYFIIDPQQYLYSQSYVDRLVEIIPKMKDGGTILYLRDTDIGVSSIPLDRALEHHKIQLKRISTLDEIISIIENLFK